MSQDTNNNTDFVDTALIEGEVLTPLSKYEHLQITKEKYIQQRDPVVTIGGAKVATCKNITGIGAPSKAGKTATSSVILAGAISKTGDYDGWPDMKILLNVHGHAVINFDTEQSDDDQQHNLNTVLKRNGFTSTPRYYLEYNLRQITKDKYKNTTSEICDLAAAQFGGIHLIVIDGGADYMQSVNDDIGASDIVLFFIHIAIKHNCPVFIVVHQNPGSEKERGHFGSEVQRKCYGLLTITKEGDVSTLAPKMMRRAGNGDIPLINFKYCKEKNYHVQADDGDADDTKAAKEMERLKVIAEKVFAPPNSYSHTEALKKIMQVTKRKITTAKSMLTNMEGFDFIIKGEDKNYRLK